VGAYNKKIPNFCFNLPKDFIVELLKGLFYGDGSYNSINNAISYCTASVQLKEQVFLLLTRLDIYASTIRREHSEHSRTWSLSVSGEKASYLAKLLDLFEENPLRKRKSHNQYWDDDNYFYMVINNIKIISHNDTVYNFEVEDAHSYVANHIVVHNCLESIATGTVPIVTTVGGLTDLVFKNVNGIVIPPKNSTELDNAIEYLYLHKERLQEMKEIGLKIIKGFSKERWEKEIIEVVKRVYGE
jgi:glycosyltransferase involved in cell wall biosynthesis